MTTRRRSTSVVILGIMAVMLAPVHAAAYDVGAARPDASVARFMLPDLEMDGAMDPVLTPMATAYDATGARPDASADRFIMPDLDLHTGGIDPFKGALIPRRAMEHPREWLDFVLWLGAGACHFGGCSPWVSGGLWVASGIVSFGGHALESAREFSDSCAEEIVAAGGFSSCGSSFLLREDPEVTG